MDWKILMTTFAAIFVAELADKTQLVGIGMAARSGKPVSVWVGSVAAYIVVTALSVALGALLSQYLKPATLRYAGGVLFMIIGGLMLANKI